MIAKPTGKPSPAADRLAALAGVPLVRGCSRGDLSRLVPLFELADLRAGARLVGYGDRMTHVFVIGSGSLATCGPLGRSVLGSGAVLGVEELFTHELWQTTVVTLEPARVLCIGVRQFLAACQTVPGFALGVLRAHAGLRPPPCASGPDA